MDELETRGVPYRLLFLEAGDEVLINRFKETRRRHPLANGGSVERAIRGERTMLAPLQGARRRLDRHQRPVGLAPAQGGGRQDAPARPGSGRLAVTFMTFGFKHGSPRDADLTFDVRFLPNPHYESELRDLTGLDQPVIDYVESSNGIQEFYDRLVPLLDYLLPAYEQEGKSHLTVCIGCTGGRHRSVVIAQHLARIYEQRDDILVDVVHRDMEKPPRRA